MSNELKVEWNGTGRRPQCAPNPAYPKGVDIDVAHGQPSCETALPYPATSIGTYVVRCPRCGSSIAVTAAGRLDDPRSVKIPCRVAAAKGGRH